MTRKLLSMFLALLFLISLAIPAVATPNKGGVAYTTQSIASASDYDSARSTYTKGIVHIDGAVISMRNQPHVKEITITFDKDAAAQFSSGTITIVTNNGTDGYYKYVFDVISNSGCYYKFPSTVEGFKYSVVVTKK